MKIRKEIFVFFLALTVLTAFFSFFQPAIAQYKNQEKIPGAEPTENFIDYMKSIINFGYAVIGILALFMLLIGAYQYLIAAGTGNVSSAKETIASTLLGLVLGLCGYIILYKINPNLVEFRDIKQIEGIDKPIAILPSNNQDHSFVMNPNLPKNYTLNAPAEVIAKIEYYAAMHGLDPNIVLRMINVESGGNRLAVSPKGAMGYGQLMPETARLLGVTDPFNIDQNIEAACRFLKDNLNKFGNYPLALAAYNGGPVWLQGFLEGRKGSKPETTKYVNNIMNQPVDLASYRK